MQEHIIHRWADKTSAFHNQLILMYKDTVEELLQKYLGSIRGQPSSPANVCVCVHVCHVRTCTCMWNWVLVGHLRESLEEERGSYVLYHKHRFHGDHHL